MGGVDVALGTISVPGFTQKADRRGQETKSHEKTEIMVPLPFSSGNKPYGLEKLVIRVLFVKCDMKRCVGMCLYTCMCMYVCGHTHGTRMPVLC